MSGQTQRSDEQQQQQQQQAGGAGSSASVFGLIPVGSRGAWTTDGHWLGLGLGFGHLSGGFHCCRAFVTSPGRSRVTAFAWQPSRFIICDPRALWLSQARSGPLGVASSHASSTPSSRLRSSIWLSSMSCNGGSGSARLSSRLWSSLSRPGGV